MKSSLICLVVLGLVAPVMAGGRHNGGGQMRMQFVQRQYCQQPAVYYQAPYCAPQRGFSVSFGSGGYCPPNYYQPNTAYFCPPPVVAAPVFVPSPTYYAAPQPVVQQRIITPPQQPLIQRASVEALPAGFQAVNHRNHEEGSDAGQPDWVTGWYQGKFYKVEYRFDKKIRHSSIKRPWKEVQPDKSTPPPAPPVTPAPVAAPQPKVEKPTEAPKPVAEVKAPAPAPVPAPEPAKVGPAAVIGKAMETGIAPAPAASQPSSPAPLRL